MKEGCRASCSLGRKFPGRTEGPEGTASPLQALYVSLQASRSSSHTHSSSGACWTGVRLSSFRRCPTSLPPALASAPHTFCPKPDNKLLLLL